MWRSTIAVTVHDDDGVTLTVTAFRDDGVSEWTTPPLSPADVMRAAALADGLYKIAQEYVVGSDRGIVHRSAG